MTNNVMHNAICFHTSNTLFHQHTNTRNPLVFRLLFCCQFPITWFLLGLQNSYTRHDKALKTSILAEYAAFW